VAIARCLVARPMLLLDEPAHIWARSARPRWRAMTQALAERAMLVIAHRYSTVRSADRIILLQDGEVVAVGEPPTYLATEP
jgi:ABC-type multidrug transport system fused ATPase/permease subunit